LFEAVPNFHSHSIYDGCFISFADIRYDSRLQNLLRSLAKLYPHLVLLQLSTDGKPRHFEGIEVISIKQDTYSRGTLRFLKSYLKLFPKALGIRAKFYCADDVHALPLAGFMANRFRVPLFYNSRELYFAIGGLSKKKFKQEVWSSLENHYIKKAKVFTTGDLDSVILQERYQIPLPTTIYNFPHFQVIKRTKRLHQELRLSEEAKILLYQGVITEGRGLWKMLEALAVLPERFVMVFIGEGILLSKLRQEINRRHLQHRAFTIGSVAHQDLLNYTGSAYIGLALIEPISKSYELALPNKLFEYTLCEIPSLVSALPAMQKVINDYGIGIATLIDHPEQIAEAILIIEGHYEPYQLACQKAKLVLNWEEQETKLLAFFQI
jgi:glycosyltransferase involved in cell wall biosynthesis